MVAGALLVLVQLDRVDHFIAFIIIGREITISALREWMAQIGASRSVAVSSLGKIKTAAQMTAIPMLLYHDVLFGVDRHAQFWGDYLMIVAAVLTVWSMFYYLRLAWPLIKEKAGDTVCKNRCSGVFLDKLLRSSIMPACCDDAGVAQLVERNLAKVEVESSRLFSRSRIVGVRSVVTG